MTSPDTFACRKELYHTDTVTTLDPWILRISPLLCLKILVILIPDLRPLKDLALGRQKKTMRSLNVASTSILI
jgi:hypothetical protein